MTRVFALSFLVLAGCSGRSQSEPQNNAPPPIPEIPNLAALSLPTGLNPARVTLGRRLFHDTRLSGDNTLSCSTCHSLDHGGAEPRRVSTGIRGQQGPINSPTVLNSHLNFVQFWDGRAASLEGQAAGPVSNPLEMGSEWPQVVERLAADATYVAEFGAAGFSDGVTQNNITSAIAEYERSLVTPARFDQFLAGNQSALTPSERHGYDVFRQVGCPTCHQGPGLGGTMYQKLGVVRDYFAARGGPITDADQGRFNVTHQESDRHRFKVPLLRNIALTAPYLHDGSQQDLGETVRIMGRFQLGRELSADEVSAIVSFLGSLTGEIPAGARMPAVAPVEATTTTSGEAGAPRPPSQRSPRVGHPNYRARF